MPNIHLHNTHRYVVYSGRAGATPTPQAPWQERRIALLSELVPVEEGGTGRGLAYIYGGLDAKARKRDLQRLIDEGLAYLSNKTRRSHLGKGGGRQRKTVNITSNGMAVWTWAQPQAPRHAVPFSKRAQQIAEFAQAQQEHSCDP